MSGARIGVIEMRYCHRVKTFVVGLENIAACILCAIECNDIGRQNLGANTGGA